MSILAVALLLISPLVVLVGALVVLLNYLSLRKAPSGTDRMRHLAEQISSGAMTYLGTQYRILLLFVVLIAVALFFGVHPGTALAFVFGAGFSMLAGYLGMKAATLGNVRTTNAAREGLSNALRVAFKGGTIMGLSVAVMGLLGILIFYLAYHELEALTRFLNGLMGLDGTDPGIILKHVTGFGMGASSIALFARVGGGIYTKSADVGADLVGKVEAGIPEDDPRNPAVIADNVGDNVGDVAGMGADLFESYVGSIIASVVLAFGMGDQTLGRLWGGSPEASLESIRQTLIGLPIAFAALGTVSSILGTLFVKVLSGRGRPSSVLRNATFVSTALCIFLGLGTVTLLGV
ncbi:sodium-translocating pyrophosphatase, partial [Candidatus Fermentibacteria bacterium]|nr:sodium-translocating pyrophosphatase [Candidatus Fermentibacteria bacterium]